ncbi:MAG: ABC transporter ATP-binding protein [Methanomicrobiales archaeon]|nr:ABC transporter ATP-binding protein [Methanomicrobiales archaeon]
MLEIERLNVFRSNLQILWDLNLRIDKGEIVALLGPNGAGKTTFVESIFGFIPKVEGTINFLEENIRGLPPHAIFRKGLALVPEKREIFPKMTVLENLRLGKGDRSGWEEDLEDIHSLFPILKEREIQLAGTLSGGEQQMLAIGRALMSNPKILVLDEPSTGLSPLLIGQVFRSLERLGREGMTILLLEQNIRNALDLCQRGYVMENGRIILEGKTKELYHNEHVQRAYLGI